VQHQVNVGGVDGVILVHVAQRDVQVDRSKRVQFLKVQQAVGEVLDVVVDVGRAIFIHPGDVSTTGEDADVVEQAVESAADQHRSGHRVRGVAVADRRLVHEA
jgi:hypothetical protein